MQITGAVIFGLLVVGAIWLNFFSRHRIREHLGYMCTRCNHSVAAGGQLAITRNEWGFAKKSCPKCGGPVIPC